MFMYMTSFFSSKNKTRGSSEESMWGVGSAMVFYKK